MWKKVICYLLVFSCVSTYAANTESWKRIQELFIWKVSDHLKLEENREQKLKDIIFSLSQEKRDAHEEMDQIILSLKKAKRSKDKAKLIVSYENALKKYNSTNTKEIEQIAKVFNTEEMAEYLILKKELTQQLKILMQKPKKNKNLGEPKIIKEK